MKTEEAGIPMDGDMNTHSTQNLSDCKLIHVPILPVYLNVSTLFCLQLVICLSIQQCGSLRSQPQKTNKPGFQGTSTQIPFLLAKCTNKQHTRLQIRTISPKYVLLIQIQCHPNHKIHNLDILNMYIKR